MKWLLFFSLWFFISCSEDQPKGEATLSVRGTAPPPAKTPPPTDQKPGSQKASTSKPQTSPSAPANAEGFSLSSLPMPSAPSFSSVPTSTAPILEQFESHISSTIKNNIEGLNACSKYSILVEGEAIQIGWIIGEKGLPKQIKVEENRLNNQPLAECVVKFLKTVTFKRKWKGFEASINFMLFASESVSA